jgi:diguanylate cyclase (GGDEF)-like protein
MSFRVILTQLLALIFCLSSFAQTNESLSVSLDKAIEYSIKSKVLTLLTLSMQKPNKAETMLAQSPSEFSNVNIGEQYLVLLSKANIAQSHNQHRQVITLLDQAQLLQKNIAKKQLATPLFANLSQVLATSLAATNHFEKAYQVIKSFVDGHNDYDDAQRDDIVKQLTEKYEITHKVETNKLLDNQNKLKGLRLDEVEKQQANQQRNFILILCSIIVIFLFYLRQLKVRKKLIILTRTDSLTGLFNRATLFFKGQKLIESSLQQHLELSVIIFEIDQFKLINDNFGHHVSDSVLAKVAQLVNETMRARDILARLDGEKFVAILPSTDIDKAKAIAVRVIEKVAQYNFSGLGIDNTISVSVGVANNHDTKAIFDDLLHAADLAMNQARVRGGNQMLSYSAVVKDQERQKR